MFARRQCWRKECPAAHEPEGWGTILFDQRDHVVASTKSSDTALPSSKPAVAPTHPGCRGCGKDLPDSAGLFCDDCQHKGTPKQDCTLCQRLTFRGELSPSGECVACTFGMHAWDDVEDEAVAPHLRILAGSLTTQVPSPAELRRLLEPRFGQVQYLCFSGDGDEIPVAAHVRFTNWTQTDSLDNVVPGCLVEVVADLPVLTPQARKQQLAKLVAKGELSEREFSVLASWLRV
jgi:hypothetical protein